MSNRNKLVPFWLPLLFGLLSLSSIVGRPSFATIRTVDVVHLIGTGMCFGASLVGLIMFFRGRRSS